MHYAAEPLPVSGTHSALVEGALDLDPPAIAALVALPLRFDCWPLPHRTLALLVGAADVLLQTSSGLLGSWRVCVPQAVASLLSPGATGAWAACTSSALKRLGVCCA